MLFRSLEVSGTEERGPESSISEHPLCNCLRDRGLSCSGEPVQPVDRLSVGVSSPEIDFVQKCSAGPLKTAIAVVVSVLCLPCGSEIIEDCNFGCRKESGGRYEKFEDERGSNLGPAGEVTSFATKT